MHPRRRFSRQELIHLSAAMVALTVAFLFVLPPEPGLLIAGPDRFDLAQLVEPRMIGTAVAVVVTGFLAHELSHKVVAQLYGHWSEFRASFSHLGLAVIAGAAFGLLIAAPGAVNIVGNVSEEENGVISAVGPLTNIAMAVPFLFLWLMYMGDPLLGFIFNKAAFFNVILAAFNMAPIRPLDGSKVIRWNPGVYAFIALVVAFQFLILLNRSLGFLL